MVRVREEQVCRSLFCEQTLVDESIQFMIERDM
jgi:hypothetical protein